VQTALGTEIGLVDGNCERLLSDYMLTLAD
jgi:hypothetical protein